MQELVLEVDVVTFAIRAERLHVLLVKRTQPPFVGLWALPGARLVKDERLDAAARRALFERTGLDVAYLEQLKAFDDPSSTNRRDPRGPTISVAYFALLSRSDQTDPHPGRGVEEAAWLPVDQTPQKLAFDHRAILDFARGRIATKVELEYAPIPFKVLPDEFTMRDLRLVYEALTGRPVTHENNFWRLTANHWILQATGQTRGGRGRPAALFRFAGSRRPIPDPETFLLKKKGRDS